VTFFETILFANGKFGLVMSFLRNWSMSELSGFYVFLKSYSTNLRQPFFGFKRKYLLNTSCFEKCCTGPLALLLTQPFKVFDNSASKTTKQLARACYSKLYYVFMVNV